jgi:hypothetical protein
MYCEQFKASMKASLGVPLFLLGFAGCVSHLVAQSAGTFAVTGSLGLARYLHTATLLPNGKVLICGGISGIGADRMPLDTAELYDPETGTFTAMGRMTTPRAGHTATLLANAKVLIAGGSTAELYDPSTGAFTATGEMTNTIRPLSAVLLSNGTVLLGDYLGQFQLYDPVAGMFSPIASPLSFLDSSGTLLPDGRVLYKGSPTAWLYDPITQTFSATGAMVSYEITTSLLFNGRVLFAGGNDDPGETDTAEMYDPSNGTFSPTGKMTAARADVAATLLPDGTVLIAGSYGDGGITLASAELYDSSTGTFTATGDMATDRGVHSATLLNDGRVLIAGGIHNTSHYPQPYSHVVLSSAEIYTPAVLLRPPVLWSLSRDGQGPGLILHADTHQVVSPDNPAVAGEAIEIYCTGLADGGVIPPQVAIGGRMAAVRFFGNDPGNPGVNKK